MSVCEKPDKIILANFLSKFSTCKHIECKWRCRLLKSSCCTLPGCTMEKDVNNTELSAQ